MPFGFCYLYYPAKVGIESWWVILELYCIQEKDRNTELVADSKRLSSLKKVRYILHVHVCM